MVKVFALVFSLLAFLHLFLPLALLFRGVVFHSSRRFYPHFGGPLQEPGALWCPMTMKWRCYLKVGLAGPSR
jgi:hypothetical protein